MRYSGRYESVIVFFNMCSCKNESVIQKQPIAIHQYFSNNGVEVGNSSLTCIIKNNARFTEPLPPCTSVLDAASHPVSNGD